MKGKKINISIPDKPEYLRLTQVIKISDEYGGLNSTIIELMNNNLPRLIKETKKLLKEYIAALDKLEKRQEGKT